MNEHSREPNGTTRENDSGAPVDEGRSGTADASSRPPATLGSGRSGEFGDGLSMAFELVATPGVFGVAGYLLDRQLGTVPIFTIAFTLIVLTYMVWKYWHLYSLELEVAVEDRRTALNSERAATEGMSRRERRAYES